MNSLHKLLEKYLSFTTIQKILIFLKKIPKEIQYSCSGDLCGPWASCSTEHTVAHKVEGSVKVHVHLGER